MLIRFAVGYDPKESAAWSVMCHSIHKRASRPVSITPVSLSNLANVLTRPRDPKQSNDFSFSRFLVPWIFDFDGWVIWADCDMLFMVDPLELWNLRDDRFAIMCVKHNHEPKETVKYLGNVQTTYAMKNWSSLMLMNCARLKMLTPEYVNTAAGLDLHQFRFIDHALIGAIPKEWNYLIGYDAPMREPKLLHWTIGGPYFRGFEHMEHASTYWRHYDEMTYCQDAAQHP